MRLPRRTHSRPRPYPLRHALLSRTHIAFGRERRASGGRVAARGAARPSHRATDRRAGGRRPRRRQARDDRRRLRQVALHSRRGDLGRRDVGVVRLPAAARGRHALHREPRGEGGVEASARLTRAILRRLEVGRVLRRRADARQRARRRDRDAGERTGAIGAAKSRERHGPVVGQRGVVRILERLCRADDSQGSAGRGDPTPPLAVVAAERELPPVVDAAAAGRRPRGSTERISSCTTCATGGRR